MSQDEELPPQPTCTEYDSGPGSEYEYSASVPPFNVAKPDPRAACTHTPTTALPESQLIWPDTTVGPLGALGAVVRTVAGGADVARFVGRFVARFVGAADSALGLREAASTVGRGLLGAPDDGRAE